MIIENINSNYIEYVISFIDQSIDSIGTLFYTEQAKLFITIHKRIRGLEHREQ